MKSGILVVLVPVRKSSEKEKNIRQAKRSMKKAEEDRDKQSDGTVYKAGDGFDQN